MAEATTESKKDFSSAAVHIMRINYNFNPDSGLILTWSQARVDKTL